MVDDATLFDAWRRGDDEAGNRLFRRHFDAVYWFFRNKLPDQADDLTQDTFRSLLNVRATAAPKSFRSYLFASARNKLYDALRAQRRRAQWDPLTHSLADLGVSPSAQIGQRREQVLLLRALEKLPLHLQIMLELYYFEQIRGPQLAEALELPEGTVRSRLRRALSLLRTAMEELSDDASLVESTVSDLGRWVEQLRAARTKG